jgi:hypothetical protein
VKAYRYRISIERDGRYRFHCRRCGIDRLGFRSIHEARVYERFHRGDRTCR